MGDKLAPVELSDRVHLPPGERGPLSSLPVPLRSALVNQVGTSFSGDGLARSHGIGLPTQGRQVCAFMGLRERNSNTICAFASRSVVKKPSGVADRPPIATPGTARSNTRAGDSDGRAAIISNGAGEGDLPWGGRACYFRPHCLATMPAFAPGPRRLTAPKGRLTEER